MAQRENRCSANCIICPQCVEMLTRNDVEGFSRCPYCNHSFDHENQLEDFLLQPIIEHWIQQSQGHPGQSLDDTGGLQ